MQGDSLGYRSGRHLDRIVLYLQGRSGFVVPSLPIGRECLDLARSLWEDIHPSRNLRSCSACSHAT